MARDIKVILDGGEENQGHPQISFGVPSKNSAGVTWVISK